MAMMKTTAERVRTGQIITNDYADGRLFEVAYPVRLRFTNPEGATMDVVRFSGWPVTPTGVRGAWAEASGGMLPAGRVYVAGDMRGRGAFGALS